MYVFKAVPRLAKMQNWLTDSEQSMTVNTVCNHNVATIDAHQGIVNAATRMREEHVGDLIVTADRDGRSVPIGILTDRDIVVGVVAKRIVPDTITVGDAMTTELLAVRDSDAIESALHEMRRFGVRRAPVVGADGELVGVLSIDDVVEHLARQLGHLADVIRTEQDTEIKARP
jgi:predicted transcriptional regulator